MLLVCFGVFIKFVVLLSALLFYKFLLFGCEFSGDQFGLKALLKKLLVIMKMLLMIFFSQCKLSISLLERV